MIIWIFPLSSKANEEIPAYDSSPNWQHVSKETKDICKSVENISIPPTNIPDFTNLKGLEKCNANELYYGFSRDPDYIKAYQCAQFHHEYGILAMLYANGKGVKLNLDIATHYACKFGGATAEIEARVKHLEALKRAGEQKGEFDICDDITSGYMMGWCSSIAAHFLDAKRLKQQRFLLENWTSQEQKTFAVLQKAFKAYLEARGGEINKSGTARAMLVIEEETALKDRLLKTLNDTNQCNTPTFSTTQYQEADRQLNVLYKKIQNKEFPSIYCINKEDIKKTQRAWLKYRDGWVTLGSLKCPNISKDSWKTLITKERIKELQDLMDLL